MNQSNHLEWVPASGVKTSMSPEAEAAHPPSSTSKFDLNHIEYYLFGEKRNKWKGVPVADMTTSESPEALMISKKSESNVLNPGASNELLKKNSMYLKEGLANMTSDHSFNYIPTDSAVNSPIVPGYIPTLGETQTQDINDLIDRETNTFMLMAVAGVSLVLLGWMAFGKSAAAASK